MVRDGGEMGGLVRDSQTDICLPACLSEGSWCLVCASSVFCSYEFCARKKYLLVVMAVTAAGSSAAADPQVPGAGRMRPTGPSVARLIQTCLCIATRPFLAAGVGIAVSICVYKQQCG